jgi:hypothetical protein
MKLLILIALQVLSTNAAMADTTCAATEGKYNCTFKASEPAKASVPRRPIQKVASAVRSEKVDQAQTTSPQQSTTVNSPINIIIGEQKPTAPVAPAACPRQEISTREVIKTEVKTVKIKVREKRRKNAVLVMGGVGPTSQHANVDVQAGTADVKTAHGGVIGLQYQRSIGDRYLLGASLLSNTTATFNFGVEF